MSRYRYVKIKGKQHPEHILAWERTHGCKVPKGYDIHHIDGNGHNNSPDNLLAIPHGVHTAIHSQMRESGTDPVDSNDPEIIKSRQQIRESYFRHHDRNLEKAKAYRESHKDELKASAKRYRDSHKEKLSQYRTKHRGELRVYGTQYARDHKEKYAEYRAKTRAKFGDASLEYLREYRRLNRELIAAKRKLSKAVKGGASQEVIDVLRNEVSRYLPAKVPTVKPSDIVKT